MPSSLGGTLDPRHPKSPIAANSTTIHRAATSNTNANQPPVLRLPVEIIIQIMGMVHADEIQEAREGRKEAEKVPAHYGKPTSVSFVLSYVCASWRQIALGTPELWHVLSLTFSSDPRLCELQVQRARQHPLHLIIDVLRTVVAGKVPTRASALRRIERCLEFFMQKSEQWNGLELVEFPDSVGIVLRAVKGKLSNLKTVTFGTRVTRSHFLPQTFNDCPSLTVLDLRMCPFSALAESSSLSQLTTCHLKNQTLRACLLMFQLCPRLVECSLSDCKDLAVPTPLPFPILLEHLTSLHIHFAHNPKKATSDNFFLSFSAPALMELELVDVVSWPQEAIPVFLTRCEQLRDLRFKRCGLSNRQLLECMNATPHLRKLDVQLLREQGSKGLVAGLGLSQSIFGGPYHPH